MPKRQDKITNLVKKYVKALEKDICVSQVVLFGSHATGKADKDSDIDLAVVSADFSRFSHIDNLKLLMLKKIEIDFSIEAIPYTPREWNNANPRSFVSAIKKSGKVVYHT